MLHEPNLYLQLCVVGELVWPEVAGLAIAVALALADALALGTVCAIAAGARDGRRRAIARGRSEDSRRASSAQAARLEPAPCAPSRCDFANAMAEFASAVCVITAAGRNREPCGMLATSVCSYSADPPAVLVCVGRNGRSHDALVSAPAFGVHLLRGGRADVARRFARPGTDKFRAVDWAWDDHVPALGRDNVVAYLRCARVAVMRHGDHVIVIGEAMRVETVGGEPLVYLRRRLDWRVEAAATSGKW